MPSGQLKRGPWCGVGLQTEWGLGCRVYGFKVWDVVFGVQCLEVGFMVSSGLALLMDIANGKLIYEDIEI